MTQALYYAPSYARLAKQIAAIAPDLDIILLDEEGRLSRGEETLAASDIAPDWFWLHSELFFAEAARQDEYFRYILDSPQASWLHTINTGLDGLPYEAVFKQGVIITNNHSQSIAIAEYVLAHVLAHYQNIASLREQQANEEWRYRKFREIYGSRWLVIGFGAIGKDVARRATAFGADVSTVRRRQDAEGLADWVYSEEDLPVALAEADVVVLACAANDETRGMVDDLFLSYMKADSVLVNIARGDLVVEAALKQALDDDRLEFAILDVFNDEPPAADSWVWHHPRVMLTPHASNAGQGMLARSEALFLDNLRRQVAGEVLQNQVNDSDFN